MLKNNSFRLILLLALAVGLTLFAFDDPTCAANGTCDEAFTDWYNANSTYEIARQSYFYGIPTTCVDECDGLPNPTQCQADCQINRQTTLGQAEIDLFGKAILTCTPLTIDECSQAQAWADQCLIDHNYTSYSDPDEALAVYAQYSACRLASKVDSCF